MQTILVVVQVLVAVALVGVVLIQRSEGGGLGMSLGGMGGFMSGRGQANFLTRATAALAALFMAASLALALVSRDASRPASILEGAALPAPAEQAPASETEPTVPLAE